MAVLLLFLMQIGISRPALQLILGQQQGVAVLVDGALGEPIDTARRIDRAAHIGQLHSLLPHTFTLTRLLAHLAAARWHPVLIHTPSQCLQGDDRLHLGD